MELTVYIPTRGRVGHSKQITLRELETLSTVKPILVCPPDEVHGHLRYWPHVLACPATNINETHQWILDNCPTSGSVALDDDMYFSHRLVPEGPKLERAPNLDPMFDWISDQLDAGFVHGGISARQGNNHLPLPTVDCIRVNNAHFFNVSEFRHLNIRLPEAPVMHDFYYTLALLTRGYANRVSYRYCWSQRGSGWKGGCSDYRTQELQTQWCETLHAEFPDFVKIVTKKALSGSSVFKGDRKDVNIQWIKAWKSRPHTIGAVPNLARR